jgi:hypothetical protein
MIWAADFDESMAYNLEENCLEALVVQLPRDSGLEMREESTENDNGTVKGSGSQLNHGNVERSMPDNNGMKSISSHTFCGLTRNFWSKNDRMQICVISSTRNGHNELPVFCVAAILIMNSQKIIGETHSFDDMIKAGALYFLLVMTVATVPFFLFFFLSFCLSILGYTICFSLCGLNSRLIR